MLKFFRKLSIRYKLVLILYMIIVPMSFGLGSYVYNISYRNAYDTTERANKEIVTQVSQAISFVGRDIDEMSIYIAKNNLVFETLSLPAAVRSHDALERWRAEIAMRLFINEIMAAKDSITSISIYGNNNIGPFRETNDSSIPVESLDKVCKTAVFDEADARKGGPVWSYEDVDAQSLFESAGSPKLISSRVIRDNSANAVIGFLSVAVNESYIRGICQSALDGGFFRFFDQNGRQLFTVGDPLEGDTLSSMELIPDMGWKVEYCVSTLALSQQLDAIQRGIVVLLCAIGIGLLPIIVLVSRSLFQPLQTVIKGMKRAQQGDFDVQVTLKQQDEIGAVGEGFNSMVKDIKTLIETTYELRLREQEAEFSALQAQINPHFLYNTLDSIFWKAQRAGQLEIADMTYALSRIFRLTLNKGQGLTTVSAEKEMILYYFELQKNRFKDRLEYSVDIQDEILPCIVPKLILQPFVENAILHGFQDLDRPGRLKVSGHREGDRLCFVVEDNGAGLNAETAKKLERGESPGYGVRNVAERLRLQYKNEHVFRVEHNLPQGVRIYMEISVSKQTDELGGGGPDVGRTENG